MNILTLQREDMKYLAAYGLQIMINIKTSAKGQQSQYYKFKTYNFIKFYAH